jgi:hypothetical protein
MYSTSFALKSRFEAERGTACDIWFFCEQWYGFWQAEPEDAFELDADPLIRAIARAVRKRQDRLDNISEAHKPGESYRKISKHETTALSCDKYCNHLICFDVSTAV